MAPGPNNRCVSSTNPAGWGFALTFSPHDTHPAWSSPWTVSFGSVRTNPQSSEGPLIGSNNTGELKGLIELFDYFLYYSDLPQSHAVIVYTGIPFTAVLRCSSLLSFSGSPYRSISSRYPWK